jgi:hypothetical protein
MYDEKRDVVSPLDPDATKAELEGMAATKRRQENFIVRL